VSEKVFKSPWKGPQTFSKRNISRGINLLYELGPFRLNPQKRLLLREDEPVPLSPKACDSPLVLVHNSGKVVLNESSTHARRSAAINFEGQTAARHWFKKPARSIRIFSAQRHGPSPCFLPACSYRIFAVQAPLRCHMGLRWFRTFVWMRELATHRRDHGIIELTDEFQVAVAKQRLHIHTEAFTGMFRQNVKKLRHSFLRVGIGHEVPAKPRTPFASGKEKRSRDRVDDLI
jgi:hypothetical protein